MNTHRNAPEGDTSPTITTDPAAAGTVLPGPSGAGRGITGPAAGELAPCDSPAAPDPAELATFVGGPLNGYQIASSAAAIVVERDGTGRYLPDPATGAWHWHVGPPLADIAEHVRPAQDVEHVRPAPRQAEHVRPRKPRRPR